MTPFPTVVAARDGSSAIKMVAFQGSAQAANRDAVSYYFQVQMQPDGEVGRLAVLFSGTVLGVKPDAFGLLSSDNREADFSQFALAAIGDYIDQDGLPPLPRAERTRFK
jgi:hypothetical protein